MATDQATIIVAVRGGREARVELLGDAAAINAIGAATVRAGLAMDTATRRGFLMNQMLFTARRLAYGLTLAAGATAATVGIMGIKFNAMLEQNQLAMTKYLGSAQAATRETNILFDIAAHTPFTFEGIIQGATQLLKYNLTAKQTNRTLVDLADVLSTTANGQDAVNRAIYAFTQIETAGTVRGQELLQLANAGIPAARYLKEQFHLTGQQARQIGRLGIPAAQGIEAILRGIEADPHFAGMAAAQAKTFNGLLSTMHDYFQRFAGTLMHPLFLRMKGWFQELVGPNGIMIAAEAAFKRGGWTGMINTIDRLTGAGGKLSMAWHILASTVHSVWVIFKTEILPVLWTGIQVFGALAVILYYALQPALWLVQHNSWLVVLALKVLLGIYLWGRIRVLAMTAALAAQLVVYSLMYVATVAAIAIERIQVLWLTAGVLWTTRLTLAQIRDRAVLVLLTVARWLYNVAIAAYNLLAPLATAATIAWVLSDKAAAFWTGVLRVRLWLTNIALVAYEAVIWLVNVATYAWEIATWGMVAATTALDAAVIALEAAIGAPIIVILALVAGIVLLTAGLVIAYFKVKWFRDMVNGAFTWIKNFILNDWQYIVGFLLAGPFGLAAVAISHHLSAIQDAVQWLWDHLRMFYNWLKNHIFKLNFHLPGSGGGGLFGGWLGKLGLGLVAPGVLLGKLAVDHLAAGGVTQAAGLAVVGERGPELLYLPPAAEVHPLPSHAGLSSTSTHPEAIEVHTHIMLDRREIGEAVARYQLDRRARK